MEDFIRSNIIKSLANMINERKPEKAKAVKAELPDILNNIQYLAEPTDKGGLYVPLNIKRMFFAAVYGDAARLTSTIKESVPGHWATAQAQIIDKNGNVIAEAEASTSIDEVNSFGASTDTLTSKMYNNIRGTAEKYALFRIGILPDFTADIEEGFKPAESKEDKELAEKAEKLNKLVNAEAEKITNPAPTKDDAKADATAQKPVPAPKPVTPVKNAEPEKADPKKAEAPAQQEDLADPVIKFGPKKGKKFSEVPAKVRGWVLASYMYKKNSCDTPTDAYLKRVAELVEADSEAYKFYNDYIKKAEEDRKKAKEDNKKSE